MQLHKDICKTPSPTTSMGWLARLAIERALVAALPLGILVSIAVVACARASRSAVLDDSKMSSRVTSSQASSLGNLSNAEIVEKAPESISGNSRLFEFPTQCVAPLADAGALTLEEALQGTWCNPTGSTMIVIRGSTIESHGAVNHHTSTIRQMRQIDRHWLSPRYDIVQLVCDDAERLIVDPRTGSGKGAMLQFVIANHITDYHRSASNDCSCFADAWDMFRGSR